jgi:hypothetical protein
MKKRLDIYIPAETRDALTVEAAAKQTSVTALATAYLQGGLMQDQGGRVERQSFALIREAIQLEMRQMQAQIRQEIEAELAHWSEGVTKEVARLLAQSGSRQAALSVRALREDEATRRMVVLLAESLLSSVQAQELYERATREAGKHLALVLSQPEG